MSDSKKQPQIDIVTEYGWKHTESLSDHDYTLPAIQVLLPAARHLKILDAGCGNGYIASRLAKQEYEVTAIDASTDGIDLARQFYPGIQWEVASVYDDLTALKPEGGFDVIVSSEVIEHLFSPKRFLENMHSLLKSGGEIILTTPYHGYLKNLALSLFDAWDKHHTVHWEGGHIKFFSEHTITEILDQSGFGKPVFCNAGRVRYLWKSMVCRAEKE